MMHTAAPAVCSSSENILPVASFQLPMANQALVLPITLVAQLRPLPTTVTPDLPSGAASATPPICAWMAIASDSLNCCVPGPPPPPGPWRCPRRTISRLLPRPAIWVCTACVAPLPSVTMVITALTPMTIPRIVRKERSRLRRIERSANRRVLSSIRSSPRPRPQQRLGPRSHDADWAYRWRCCRRRSAPGAGRRRPCRARGSPSAR